MEVPTEPGCALAVIATKVLERRAAAALAEQIINIPVPQGRPERWRRSSRFSCKTEFNSSGRGADRCFSSRGLQGFPPGQGSPAFSSSRLLGDADEGIHRFFALFPGPKKSAEVTPPVECECARKSQLIRAERSSSGSCRGV